MGRKLNLSHLSPAECDHILQIVHKDFNLRSVEKERLRKIEEDVEEEVTKYRILSKSRDFNDKHCICCFSRFFIIFNPRILCDICLFKVCRNCFQIDTRTKKRCCKPCIKQRQLREQSNDWFYATVEKRFRRCGSAKVIRSLYKRRRDEEDVVSLTFGVIEKPCVREGLPRQLRCRSYPLDAESRMLGEGQGCRTLRADEDAEEEDSAVVDLWDRGVASGLQNALAADDSQDGSASRFNRNRFIVEETEEKEEEQKIKDGSEEMRRSMECGIQTERDGQTMTEVGTMTTLEAEDGDAAAAESAAAAAGPSSRGFSGFDDGMSRVSTEGQELDPQFLARPHNIRVFEAEPLVVECRVSGTDPVDVLWFCNRNQVQQLEESDRCEMRRHGNTFTLVLYEMRPDDSREYLCIAVNAVGQCAQGFSVTVDENAHAPMALKFNNDTSDCIEIVPEGSEAVLRCSVSAYPEPKVTWFKNNKKLLIGGRMRTERHVPGALQYSLVIESVRPDDSGCFCAVARNVTGEARLAIQLLVQPNSRKSSDVAADSAAAATVLPSSASVDAVASCSSSEDDLMRLAQGVSRTQGRYTTTATRMLRSADMMSSMQSQLDEMDRALQDIEGEVLDVISDGGDDVDDDIDDDVDEDEDSMNNNRQSKRRRRRGILDDLDEMNSSAEAVGMVTSAALQLLSSAKDIAMETLTGRTRQPEEEFLDGGAAVEDDEDEEDCVDASDLDLSYPELEKLYEVGLISRSQLRNRLVQKRKIRSIRCYLQSTMTAVPVDLSEDSAMETSANSLETEPEKMRGKRESAEGETMETSGSVSGEGGRRKTTVRSGEEAGERSEKSERGEKGEVLRATEQQIYLTSGKVFNLEERIQDLEQQVLAVDENTSAETLAALENSVAKAVAQVTQSDREVSEIERQVEKWMNKNCRQSTSNREDATECNDRFRQQQQQNLTQPSASNETIIIEPDAENNI